MDNHRFSDKNLTLSDFEQEVWVVCPTCTKQALATLRLQDNEARLQCVHCGFNKVVSTTVEHKGRNHEFKQAAHGYFNATLWFTAPFGKHTFLAYNLRHLEYLEQYIRAKLREHRDRERFTLLERLPRFYHEARNRDALLKLIGKLKEK